MPQEKNILVNRGIPRTPSSSSGFGFSAGGVSGPDHSDRAYDAVDYAFEWLNESNTSTEELFNENIKNIIYITEAELAKTRAAVAAVVPLGTDAIEIELRTLKLQLSKARTDHQEHIGIANLYYGHDPLTHKAPDANHKGFELIGRRGGQRAYYNAITKWNVSYAAAYEAKFLAEQIKLLDARLATQNNAIAEANAKTAAAAQARAQAEAQRVAEEQARLAAVEANRVAAIQAEQHRQQTIAEAARRQKEQQEIQAREQERLAALAETQRLAAERARLAAEAAARQLAAEQASLAALADLQRRKEAEKARIERENKLQAERTRLERQQKALKRAQRRKRKQARKNARAEAERQAEQSRLHAQWQAETEARWQRPTFANVGSMTAFGPSFTGTLGSFGNNPTTALALRTALRTGVSLAVAALSTATAPVLVGFATLLAPSSLGNGDLYSASVPLSDLAPDLTADLYELAATEGEVDLPVRLGSRTIGNRVEIVVVTTDGVTVPASVPVRFAHFDARKNVYVSGNTASNGPVITWTPLIEPQDPSTEFPLIDTDLPIYEGATVTPDTGRVDPFPELDRYGFGGFITVFPIESGIPPTFTMFRDRRQDPGVASGAGQPVSGNWLGAASTGEGAPIPMQIADKFRGREFSSFKAFRRTFWKAMGDDELLSGQFTKLRQMDMKHRLAPAALPQDQVGRRIKYEIHHINPIGAGGEVYDMDNLRVMTPKLHISIHSNIKGE
ncbi:S-type pyocin domain-containing protein [Pseudomonas farris]